MRGGPQRIPRPEIVEPGGAPGWEALAPADRQVDLDRLRAVLAVRAPGPPRYTVPVPYRRSSAVLVPLYADVVGEPHVVLTRRTGHLRQHSGEVSFPGGGHDPDDVDLWATALREAWEEVAMPPEVVHPIGRLDPLATLSPDAHIHPYVGLLAERPALRPDPGEVDAILDVPIAELLLDGVFRAERWALPDGTAREVYFFDLVGDTVWGATARMLHQLLTIALGLEP